MKPLRATDDAPAALESLLPGMGAGVRSMMDAVERGQGALPAAMRELIYILLYAAADDEPAARRHVAAARAAGLTDHELAQGLAQLVVVQGMSTWTRLGWRLLAHPADEAVED